MLSPDEREKVLSKREKNKIAAEKCRIKRRENVQRVRAEYDEYLEANEALESQIQRAKEEVQRLQELLDNHRCVIKQEVWWLPTKPSYPQRTVPLHYLPSATPPLTSHLASLVLVCSYLFIYCCQWWFFFTANHWCISHPSFHDP